MDFAIINNKVNRLRILKELPNNKVEIESQFGIKKILNKAEIMTKLEADEKIKELQLFQKDNGKKICVTCKELLNFSFFGKNRSTNDGFQRSCKNCMKKYNQKSKAKKRENQQLIKKQKEDIKIEEIKKELSLKKILQNLKKKIFFLKRI